MALKGKGADRVRVDARHIMRAQGKPFMLNTRRQLLMAAAAGLASLALPSRAQVLTMASVGVLFALPVAALLARRRKGAGRRQLTDEPIDTPGSTSPRSLSANYWRDRGHPPLMKPSDGDPDKHMFDPDRLS